MIGICFRIFTGFFLVQVGVVLVKQVDLFYFLFDTFFWTIAALITLIIYFTFLFVYKLLQCVFCQLCQLFQHEREKF